VEKCTVVNDLCRANGQRGIPMLNSSPLSSIVRNVTSEASDEM